MDKNTVISVNNVSKQYVLGKSNPDTLRDRFRQFIASSGGSKESFWALKDLSFTVDEGEVLGIIGKNGAGKSTILKLMSRIAYPTKGDIEIRGKVASLLEVGTGFHPELTGKENVYLNGSILGMTKRDIDRRYDEIIDFSGVSQFIDTPVKHYSSGMKVRLAFAVAAHLEPEVLIVDEVLAVGDADFQKQCLGRMKTVSQEGRTVVFVSHNLDAVRSLCSKAVVLQKGQKIFDGGVEEAIKTYMQKSTFNEDSLVWRPDSSQWSSPAVLHRIELKPENGQDLVQLGESFEIEFEFGRKHPDEEVDVTFQLRTIDGVLLMMTSSYYLDIDRSGSSEERFLARCRFPAYTLNEGSYVISKLLVVGTGGKVMFETQDCFSFQVHFNPDSIFGLQGRNKGFFRPLFDWEMSKCND